MLHSPHKSFGFFNSKLNFELCKKYFYMQILNMLSLEFIKQASLHTMKSTKKKNGPTVSTQFNSCVCFFHAFISLLYNPNYFHFFSGASPSLPITVLAINSIFTQFFFFWRLGKVYINVIFQITAYY